MVANRGSASEVKVTNLSAELLGGNVYLVHGRSEPGTTIRVAGREALVPADGGFQIQITAPAGENQITVQAQDSQGNNSQYRLPLHGRGGSGRD
jgi:hypothetical protein